MKLFIKKAAAAVISNASKLASGLLKDDMPKYHTLFEEDTITPAKINYAIRAYRTDGKMQDLGNIFDLFLDSDDALQSAVQVRKEALKSCLWAYDDGFPQPRAEFYDALLKDKLSGWIDIFIEGKLYGYHFLQVLWEMSDGMYLPKDLVGYSNLDIRIVNRELKLYEGERPRELPEMKFINILYRRPKLHTILKYYVFYAIAINNWAQFTETYGKPLRLGKYDPGIDSKELAVLKQAVKSLGTDQSGIISKNTEIDFVDFAGKEGSKNLYETLCNFVSTRVTKAILGQTLTTDHGDVGSYALGQVHNQVRGDIMQADIEDLQRFLNTILGYVDAGNFGTGVNLWLSLPKAIDLEKRMSIDSQLVSMGLPISEDYFYDTYGVDRPARGQKVVEAPAMPAFAEGKPGPETIIANTTEQLSAPHAKSLAKLQAELRALKSIDHLKAYRPRWWIAEFGQALAVEAVQEYAKARKAKSKANSLPKIVFEWDESGVEMANRLRNQSMIISGVRTMAQLTEIKNEAAGILAQGGSFADFIQSVTLKGFEPENPYHLKTEFDTARIAAYAAGKWDEIQANKDIFPYLKYVTMRDDLVRDEHRILDGTVAAVDDIFWQDNYPPNGWNCRCTVEELTEDEAKAEPTFGQRYPEATVDPGYKGNVGQSRSLPSDAIAQYEKYLDKVLESLSDSAQNLMINTDRGAYYTDVLGYPIDLAGNDNAKASLSSPAEIWQSKDATHYIQKAADKVTVVRAESGKVAEVTVYDAAAYLNDGREGYLEYGV
jgi:SPP1 gp7 family putative phage head morphogenesis protein